MTRPVGSSLLRTKSLCRLCRSNLQRQRRLATIAPTAESTDIYDVVVVGGGPAGLSLATALRLSSVTAPLRIALLESSDLNKTRQWTLPTDEFSNRVSSITPTSRHFLERIGAWPHLDQTRIQDYRHMRVWDGLSHRGRVEFDATEVDGPMGYMTENLNLTRGLLNKLDEVGNVSIIDKTSVSHIGLGPPAPRSTTEADLSQYPHVTLSNDKVLATRLLIGADGINGPVRKFAAIDTMGWDYDRVGVVATLKLSQTDKGSLTDGSASAYQRFLPSGPIALLPLPGDYATLVWSITPDRAAKLKSLSPANFLAMVNAGFRLRMVDLDYMFAHNVENLQSELDWRLSIYPTIADEHQGLIPPMIESCQPSSIAAFPLRIRQANTYIAHRIALIGDAAHVTHPLAGQGLNMGLRDAESLTDTITQAMTHGADIGVEMTCLDGYNAQAWWRNWQMLGVVDKLHWLYRSRNPLIVAARGFGLGSVNSMLPLKSWFMRQAGGRT